MPCLYCRKMCCLNGSRKLHFVQKISGPKLGRYIDPLYFLRQQFSVAIEATIFRIERRAIEAQRLQSIFTFIYIEVNSE